MESVSRDRPDHARGLTGADIAVFLGAVPVLVGATRLLLMSQGDGAVLAALIREVDLTALMTGVVVSTLPAAIIYGGVWLFYGTKSTWGADDAPLWKQLVWTAWVVLPLYITVFVSWLQGAILIAVTLGFVLLTGFFKRFDERAGKARPFPVEVTALVAAAVYTLSGPPNTYPLEEIALADGTTRTGYVLSNQEVMAVVWEQGGLTYLERSDYRDRKPCLRSSYFPPLLDLDAASTTPCLEND